MPLAQAPRVRADRLGLQVIGHVQRLALIGFVGLAAIAVPLLMRSRSATGLERAQQHRRRFRGVGIGTRWEHAHTGAQGHAIFVNLQRRASLASHGACRSANGPSSQKLAICFELALLCLVPRCSAACCGGEVAILPVGHGRRSCAAPSSMALEGCCGPRWNANGGAA